MAFAGTEALAHTDNSYETVEALRRLVAERDVTIAKREIEFAEKKDEILFLRNTNRALEQENDELIASIQNYERVNKELQKDHADLKRSHAKEIKSKDNAAAKFVAHENISSI